MTQHTIQNINTQIKNYFDWLCEKTEISKVRGRHIYEISLPFIGLYNDNIMLYVIVKQGKLFITDAGDVMSELSTQAKRVIAINKILSNHGITINKDEELQIEVGNGRFNQCFHSMLETILEIENIANFAD